MRLRDCKARGLPPVRRRFANPSADPLADSLAKPLAGSLPVALLLTSLGICVFGGCSSQVVGARAAAETVAEPASTGSIHKVPTSFGDDLGEEDWRRAQAALSVALDPQGNGRPVRWDNPESGMRGSVNPTGLPYVADDEICRDFLATVVNPNAGRQTGRFLRGTGCKPSGGAWTLRHLRTAKDAAGKDAARKDAARRPGRA